MTRRLLSALLLVIPLTSCDQVSRFTGGGSLSADPGDPCGTQRTDFVGSKNYFTNEIVTSALIGAGLGALGGLAVASVTHANTGKSMLVGAAGGGVAGGLTGYAKTVAEHSRDREEMAQHVNDDLRREGQEIDHTTATFARLRSCRFQQALLIKSQVRSRVLTREAGLSQLAQERSWFDQELSLARQYDVTMANRGSEFDNAASALRQNPTPSTRAVTVASSVSIPEKRRSFDRAIVSAESGEKLAFDLDNNAQITRRSDDLFHS